MHFYLDCLPCILKYAVAAVRLSTNNLELQEKTMRRILQETVKFDFQKSAPCMTRSIQRIIREECACIDPYKEIKQQFNQGMLHLYPYLEKSVQESADPFEQAIRYAASANILDCGILSDINVEQAQQTLEQSVNMPLRFNTAQEFAEDIQKAEKILYLADNAGEIVADKLLLSRMPHEKVTFVVRGLPISNDAVREDAEAAGITDLVRVIDNGSDLPGTYLPLCSPAFEQEFTEADLIIAKGQGNFETMNNLTGKKIYFIFKAKCHVVADYLGCLISDIVLKRQF